MNAIAILISRFQHHSRRGTGLLGLLLTLGFFSPFAAEASVKPHGGWRLADASSPYLRLHADNPVEWYPWGEAAFAKAKAENKPLFISIGYFTCHWCHVMERESFSNPIIAQLLNKGFVAIKIDREQRPDLDAAYMSFVVATHGTGGWPMTVLATPDGTPFFGGTYFPPDTHNDATGLRQLLPKVSTLWKQQRKQIVETSRQAVEQLRQRAAPAMPLTEWTKATVEGARRQFSEDYDPFHGGFGSAPKFPQPPQLLFLLSDDDRPSAEMALHTLNRMAAGGIHDQLGGGFHRYATDPAWRVPHFEKMLYDQALIARAYLAAFRRTGDKSYADIARKTLDFVLESMRDARGGFYSALDADSTVSGSAPPRREEGAYYTWDDALLKSTVTDAALRQWVTARYDLKPGGNLADNHSPELSGKNILYVARTAEELAKDFSVDLATARQRLAEADRLLLIARRQRPAPPIDDKIVTAWNGFMITALAEAAQLLDEARYRRAAEAASRFVLKNLYDAGHNRLYRDWRAGRRGVAGFCEDYAAMTEGLLALYGLSGNKEWLTAAQKLTEAQIKSFWDSQAGGFYSAGPDSRLWIREKTASDNVIPSANALSVGNLLRLGSLTGDRRYTEKAIRTSAWQGGMLREAPVSMPYTLTQWPALMAQKGGGGTANDR